MDALFPFVVAILALLVLAGLSATLGVDSRDGFADDRYGTSFR
jgi:hypothetical protein